MEKQATAKAMNAVFTDRLSQRDRWTDDNGFLHISLRFMRTGLLKYAPATETFPDGVPPGAVGPDGKVTVLVEPEDLAEPDSLASLAGLDCLREHEWASPDKPRDNVGSVAGVPEFDGEYVVGEAVIKDAETMRRLNLPEGDKDRLIEDSAAYSHVIEWEREPYAGKAYAGRQKHIRYNHFVLLPEGEGRCGPTVRVTNADDAKEKHVSDRKEGRGEIAGSGAGAENEEPSGDGNEGKRRDAGPEKAEAARDEERKAMIGEMIAKIAALAAERDELIAQLGEARASLEAGADRIEAAADRMAAEREDAAEVMNANGIDRARAMDAFREKRLRGRDLKVFAMNSIREKKGRDAIPPEQAANDIAVNAMWDIVKDSAPAKTAVVGAPLIGSFAMNSDERRAMREKTLHGLGFRKKQERNLNVRI